MLPRRFSASVITLWWSAGRGVIFCKFFLCQMFARLEAEHGLLTASQRLAQASQMLQRCEGAQSVSGW